MPVTAPGPGAWRPFAILACGAAPPPRCLCADPLIPVLQALGRLLDGPGKDPRRPQVRRLLAAFEVAAAESARPTGRFWAALRRWGDSPGAEAEVLARRHVEEAARLLRGSISVEVRLAAEACALLRRSRSASGERARERADRRLRLARLPELP